MRRIGVVALLLVLGGPAAGGQGLRAPRHGEAYSTRTLAAPFFTDAGPNFALVRDRRVFMFAWQRERVLLSGSRAALSWIGEIPVSLVAPRKNAPHAECFHGRITHREFCFAVEAPYRPWFAVGITPLGLRASLNGEAGVRPFASFAIGVVVFDRDMPVQAATAANYSLDYTIGAELLGQSGKAAVTVAWRFQHWSNGGATTFNPGLEANLLQIGVKRKRR